MAILDFNGGDVRYYPYHPSIAAGYIFMTLFILLTLLHATQLFVYRNWFFIPLILGGVCEIFGYYGRAWAGRVTDSPSPFMLQLMLILVAPVFIAATVYAARRRVMRLISLHECTRHTGDDGVTIIANNDKVREKGKDRKGCCSCSSSTFFILTDVVAFCTQIGGSLVQVTGNPHIMDIGQDVVLAGLIFQLVVMAVYLALVVRLYRRIKVLQSSPDADLVRSQRWLKLTVLSLAASVALIWLRNLVRAIEFSQGFYGFVNSHEVMLYVFDGSLMLFVLSLLAIMHPGRLIRTYHVDSVKTGTNYNARDLST